MKTSHWISGIGTAVLVLSIIVYFASGHLNSAAASLSAATAQSSSSASFVQNSLVSSQVSVDACSYLSSADIASVFGSNTIQTQMMSPAVCQYQSTSGNEVNVAAMVTSINYNSAAIDADVYGQALKAGALPLPGIGAEAVEQILAGGSAVSVFKDGDYVQIEVGESQPDSMLKAENLAKIAAAKM